MKTIKCKNCGEETTSRGEGTSTEKKFCSRTCGTRYVSKERYNRLKDTKEYKDIQRSRFNTWLDKNREHYNDMVREPNRLYQQRLREKYRAEGLCMKCGRARDSKFLNCNKCRKKLREKYEAKQNKMRRM